MSRPLAPRHRFDYQQSLKYAKHISAKRSELEKTQIAFENLNQRMILGVAALVFIFTSGVWFIFNEFSIKDQILIGVFAYITGFCYMYGVAFQQRNKKFFPRQPEINPWTFEIFSRDKQFNFIQIVRVMDVFLGVNDQVDLSSMKGGNKYRYTLLQFDEMSNSPQVQLILQDEEGERFIAPWEDVKFYKIYNCEETLKLIKPWWDVENERRNKIPKFLVINDYPGSKYPLNSIQSVATSNFEIDKSKLDFFEKYPHLFQLVKPNLANVVNKTGILED